MKRGIQRRKLLQLVATSPLAGVLGAHAQPTGVTRLVVGFPPGGIADGLARILSPGLGESLGTVVVDNRPGASGQLAADYVRHAAPDGASVLLTPMSIMTLVPHLYKKPLFDSLRDFSAVGSVCDHSFALAVPATSPIKSVAEFVTWCKANPNLAAYGSPGAGTSPHFFGVMLGRATGVALTHIPYKGFAPAMQDLIGSQIPAVFQALPILIEYHKAGKIRVLAISNSARVASLPDVPTFAELDLASMTYTEWYGMFVSHRTPDAIVGRLQAAAQAAIARPEVVAAARRLEVMPLDGSASSLKSNLMTEYKRWGELVESTGIQLES